MWSMRAIVFDTLAYAKKLIAAGFTEQQAEGQAEAIAELIDNNLATKRDIEEIKIELKNLENKIIVKVGGMMAASIAIVTALVKLL